MTDWFSSLIIFSTEQLFRTRTRLLLLFDYEASERVVVVCPEAHHPHQLSSKFCRADEKVLAS